MVIAASLSRGRIVLEDVNFSVDRGQTLCILGRSGVGKSVALRMLMGFLTPDAGSIRVEGQEVVGLSEEGMQAIRRRVTMVFQNGALFDSMSVRENLEFPLTRVLRMREQDELDKNVDEVLEAVGLKDAIDKMPSDLSGGMRKRVGLARTLIVKPEIMLYDEPTTGLDPIARNKRTHYADAEKI